jgi:hypothetical protein
VNYSGITATFNPTSDFLPNTLYTAHITTGVNNTLGTALTKDTVWTFSTGDFTPEVVFTDPANLDANVALNKTIAATFNVAMDPTTFSNSTFTLKVGNTSIPGVVSYSGVTATFNPNSDLTAGTTYTANITTGVKSVTNKTMQTNHQWEFTTPASTVIVPFIDLLSVARFGIISGVGVSNNAGASVINNLDVGIYPGARSSITGFPPATIVNGKTYAADDGAAVAAMLKQAKLDLVAAYLYAAGLPASATISGNQGGKTLAPGVYKSTSTLSVDGSPLTLDAQGDPNAIRTRAGIVGTAYTATLTTKDDFRTLIHNERRIELCFEGNRFWDLRRWVNGVIDAVGLSKLNEPVAAVSINSTATEFTPIPILEVRSFQPYMIYGPIPYSETLKYNIIQNQGW